MGFDLKDIGNEKRIIFVNFWNWRPTVEVLRRTGLLDAKRLDELHEQFSGTRVTKDEARAIAHHLREKVLPNLPHTARSCLMVPSRRRPTTEHSTNRRKTLTRIMGQSVHGWRSSPPSAKRAIDLSSTKVVTWCLEIVRSSAA
jgi:hypothetical protein